MLRGLRCASLPLRCPYSTGSDSGKVPVKLIAELRRRTEVSMVKAREALAATNCGIDAALQWLEDDLAASGATSAAKVSGRTTSEGVICLSVVPHDPAGPSEAGLHAAMVELNCETDFVGQNYLFAQLASDIAYTAACTGGFSSSTGLDELMNAALLSERHSAPDDTPSVKQAIHKVIAKTKENITLRRATTVVRPSTLQRMSRLGSYVHGTTTSYPNQGRMAAFAVLTLSSDKDLSKRFLDQSFSEELGRLERAVARQVIAFNPRVVRSPNNDPNDGTALYNQPFDMYQGHHQGTVLEVLQRWAQDRDLSDLAVEEFKGWQLGGPLDVPE